MTVIRLSRINIKINVFLYFTLMLFFVNGYLIYTLISFSIVFIHELSHTLVANVLGYKVKEIEIFPLGGVVKLEHILGINPKHEILVAAAGPLSNLILSMTAYFIVNQYNILNNYIIYFIYANAIIAVTNLLPILPLDGGRICRAYISYIIGFKKATKLLIFLSKILSILLFIMGFFLIKYDKVNIVISLVAVFLYLALRKEKEMAIFILMQEIMNEKMSLFEKGILRTRHLATLEGTPVKRIINRFHSNLYHIVTVMDDDNNVIGVLTESDILDGIIKYGLDTSLEKLLKNRKRW